MTIIYRQYYEFPDLQPEFHGGLHLIAISLSLVCAVLGSLRGVLAVLRLQPAESMRTAPPRRGGRVWIEHVRWLWVRLSSGWRLAVRCMFRQRYRTLAGVFAAAMGAGLLVTGCGGPTAEQQVEAAQAKLQAQDYDGAATAAAEGLAMEGAQKVTKWQLELLGLEAQARGGHGEKAKATLERLAGERSCHDAAGDERHAVIRRCVAGAAGDLVEELPERLEVEAADCNGGPVGDDGPSVFVSGSAIGIYGSRGDEVVDEHSVDGDGFLADVCRAWEAAAVPASGAARVALVRTGIVLTPEGGALAKMLPLFKFGLGGRFGKGDQYMSWITLHDEVRAIEHALTADLEGPVNLTAPNPVTNREFADALGDALRRPSFLPVPAFGPRLVLGRQLADALLFDSVRVAPAALTEAGFEFDHTDIETAFAAILD